MNFSDSFQSFVYILYIYWYIIYCSKSNCGVSRSSYAVIQRIYLIYACIFYFLKWKYFFNIWEINPSLSKTTLKNQVCCQVFWIKVRRLQDQCRSIWALVFHYFVSNILRSSHQRCSVKQEFLENFAKFTGKYLCQSLFFKKKKTLALVFSCEFCEISRSLFLQNTFERLLLCPAILKKTLQEM